MFGQTVGIRNLITSMLSLVSGARKIFVIGIHNTVLLFLTKYCITFPYTILYYFSLYRNGKSSSPKSYFENNTL
jgi:hypothetical protein